MSSNLYCKGHLYNQSLILNFVVGKELDFEKTEKYQYRHEHTTSPTPPPGLVEEPTEASRHLIIEQISSQDS